MTSIFQKLGVPTDPESRLACLSLLLSESKVAETVILDSMKAVPCRFIFYKQPTNNTVAFQFWRNKTVPGVTPEFDNKYLIRYTLDFASKDEADNFVKEIKRFNRRKHDKEPMMRVMASCMGSYIVCDDGIPSFHYQTIGHTTLVMIFPNNFN